MTMFERAFYIGPGFVGVMGAAPAVLCIADAVAFATSPSSNRCTTILESLVATFAYLYTVI